MDRRKLDETIAAMFSNPEYHSSYLFYAHMIGQCSIKIDENCPSPAGVTYEIDHYNLYINPSIFDKYPLTQRLFILKHEMLHILYDHVGRKGDKDHMLWNYATDCAINQQDNLGHVPEQCVTPETMSKYFDINVVYGESSEYYYEVFKNNINNKDPQDGESDIDSPESPELLDNHDMWQQSNGDGELQKDITKKMIEKAQDETIKGKGSLPDNISEILTLHTRTRAVCWKKMLRNIIGNKKTNRRTSIMRQARRFPKRQDLRGTLKDRVFNLLVIADVSASMDDEALLKTLGEVQNICTLTNTNLDLIQVDTEAYKPEKLTKTTKIIERKGSGGTILYPAIEKAKEYNIDYHAIVGMTDGYMFDEDIEQFKNLNKKIIWLIEPNGFDNKKLNQGLMKSIKLV
jgi:predicted metal-dependent peptidase